MEQKKQIIYSMKVMLRLVELGFYPVWKMPNPRFPQYECWVFDLTPEFQCALATLLGGKKSGE